MYRKYLRDIDGLDLSPSLLALTNAFAIYLQYSTFGY
jgi:hypothetical protein